MWYVVGWSINKPEASAGEREGGRHGQTERETS